MTLPRLSVIVITLNEEERLPGCLTSVKGLAEEMVVVDTGSRDRTIVVAEQAGARVARMEFLGDGPCKQRALELATGRWVLLLDADERVTPGLREEIRGVIAGGRQEDGFWIRREVYYLGRRMRYGGLGSDAVLRLFRRDRGRCTPVKIHSRVEVEGTVGRLKGSLEHHTVRTLVEHIAKIESYGKVRTDQLAARGRRYRLADWLRIPVELFLRIVVRLAFLDGARGIVYATMTAFGKWLRYARLVEREPPPGR